MRAIVPAAIVAVAALAACSETIAPEAPRATASADVPGDFIRVEIDGMPCIVWINERGAGQSQDSFSGLTCNWGPR